MITLKIDLGDINSFQILPLGDMHIGDEFCDTHAIKEAIDYIETLKKYNIELNQKKLPSF